MSSIPSSLKEIQKTIPAPCTLVAVSKTKPNSDIMEAYESGHRDFGENKVQELTRKAEELPEDFQGDGGEAEAIEQLTQVAKNIKPNHVQVFKQLSLSDTNFYCIKKSSISDIILFEHYSIQAKPEEEKSLDLDCSRL